MQSALDLLKKSDIRELTREEVLFLAKILELNIAAPLAVFYDLMHVLQRHYKSEVINFLHRFRDQYSNLSKDELQQLAGFGKNNKYYPYSIVIRQLIKCEEKSSDNLYLPSFSKESYEEVIHYNSLDLAESRRIFPPYVTEAMKMTTDSRLVRNLCHLFTRSLLLEKEKAEKGENFLRHYGIYHKPVIKLSSVIEYNNFVRSYELVFKRSEALPPLTEIPVHLITDHELVNYTDTEIINFLTGNRLELWYNRDNNRKSLLKIVDRTIEFKLRHDISIPGAYLWQNIVLYRGYSTTQDPSKIILLNEMLNGIPREDLAMIPRNFLKSLSYTIKRHRREIEETIYQTGQFDRNLSGMIGKYILYESR